jgi:hypothetical protein
MRSTTPLFSPLIHIWNKLWHRDKIPPQVRNALLMFVTVIFAVTFTWVIQSLMLVVILRSIAK